MTIIPDPSTVTLAPAATPVQPGRSRLDSVPQGQPFSMDKLAQDRAETPKQHYDQPDIPKPEEPAPPAPLPGEPGALVTPGTETNRKSAKFIIGMLDRVQANGFALVATNEDPEPFRMTEAEKAELATYLEEGVAQGKFQVPWWLPFIVCTLLIGFAHYRKAIKIRKEVKAQMDDLLEDTGVKSPEARMADLAVKLGEQTLQQRREEREAKKRNDPPVAPAPPPVKAPGACGYCGKVLPSGQQFCDKSHAALFQHAKERGDVKEVKKEVKAAADNKGKGK